MEGETTRARDDQPPGVRVWFGAGADDHVSLNWAQAILTGLREQYPSTFGKLVSQVALGRGRDL